MKKNLIYHLYIGGDYKTDIIYKLHSECLKCFKYIFDAAKIVISVDNINDKEIIKWGIEWVNNIFSGIPIEISVIKNNPYREAITFYNKVLKNVDDELVFFFHDKGVTNFKDPERIDSVFMWICAIYYYGLNPLYDTLSLLENGNKTMCGPLLFNQYDGDTNEYCKPFYAGAGYWINVKSLRNLEKMGIVPKIECNNRFLAEKYPGMVLNAHQEYGLDGTKRLMLDFTKCDGTFFYHGLKSDWEKILSQYGDTEDFNAYVNYICEKVGFYPYNNKEIF